MEKAPDIVLIWPTALVSLVASLLLTWLAWELLIPGRAFQCKDDGLDVGFWMSADTHRSAGDQILSGWTWEKLERVNSTYKLAFLAAWIGGGLGSFRALKSILKE